MYRFQLVVVDNSNNTSQPDVIEVIVADTTRPTAVVEAIPRQPEFGTSFELRGSASKDLAPGQIVNYIWTLVE